MIILGKEMNGIEIFSGAGGLAKGLELAGVKHCALVEWNVDACRSLRLNYASRIVHEEDIRHFDFSDYHDVDIIAGGPPCQPFSLGGKARGVNDSRDMFPFAVKAIRMLRPKAFVFENVKGLLRKSFAEYFDYILLQLTYPDVVPHSADWRENHNVLMAHDKVAGIDGKSYNVTFTLVNAADYGVPQTRERVIIVGFRNDIGAEWAFPKPTHSKEALLWSQFVTGDYWIRHGIKNYYPDNVSDIYKNKLKDKLGLFGPELEPWVTVRDAVCSLGEPDGNGDHQLRGGAKEYAGHTGSEMDWPSKTIKAGSHGVPGGENMIRYPNGDVRYMSIAEAKRIQTFPDSYKISGSWSEAMRQLGNAVPVRLGNIVAESVVDALRNAARQRVHGKSAFLFAHGTITDGRMAASQQ